MAKDFLSALGNQLNQQYGNSNSSKPLELGDFGKKIDKSAHRQYNESGFLRNDPYNSSPKLTEVFLQDPNATVLVKKRQFSSLAENFRPDYMDNDERLYYKSMKILFQNKCVEIAAYEKLFKIQKITESVGNISDQLIPIITTLTDTIAGGLNVGTDGFFSVADSSNSQVSNFIKTVDRIRKIYAFNTSAPITSWITDSTNLFQTQYGAGTGVIEITNFSSFSTTTTINIENGGKFSLSISDPYEIMLITEYDIEKAISDATNSFYNHSSVQFAKEAAEKNIAELQSQLSQIRANRGASPISLKIDPDTMFGKKVIAIIDRLGIELIFKYNGGFGGINSKVSVADDYLKGGDIAGFDGLNPNKGSNIPGTNIRALVPNSELSIFQQLISAIFSKIQLDESSRNVFKSNNQDTNYVRRKLRFNFSGKLIIQPMDTVHIYLNSKGRYDNRLMTGLTNMFNGAGILQNLNNMITGTANQIESLLNPSGNVNMQLEKAAFVGSDFPNFLWSMIRNQFVVENEGTHVFAGLVDNATDNWNNGAFTVDINGRDNSAYFDIGQVNFKPSADVFNGALYDPLTPFKTRFDEINTNFDGDIPQLLDENKALLSQDGSAALLKFKSGTFAGIEASSDRMVQDPSVDPITGAITKTIHAPDGLVYKWKEGIGVLTQMGTSLTINNPNLVGRQAITNKNFAGRGVMDVISMLITGQPYNFATYWKSVNNYDGIQADPQSKQSAAYNYYASLQQTLSKNNITWGNFIPFKNLVIDEQTYSKAINSQIRGQQINQNINNKLKKLAELNRTALLQGVAKNILPGDSGVVSALSNVQAEMIRLSEEIGRIISAAKNESEYFSSAQNINQDVSNDYSTFIDSSKTNISSSDPNIRRSLRRQINFLTRRMSYNVRGNEDKNLFIVDDFYDKDYDVQAYEQSLTSSLELYSSAFTSVKNDITSVAQLLNLEVFCDTQGHIRVRPPQYNRIPSSVFYRMMFLKKTQGIQIFPQFLEDLFTDQITALKQRVEILEDQIRLDCAIIGLNTDADCLGLIMTGPDGGVIAKTSESFTFLSNEGSGQITDFDAVIQSANPEQLDAFSTGGDSFLALQFQAQSTKSQFSELQRASVVFDALSSVQTSGLSQAGYSITNTTAFNDKNPRIDELIKRIETASGLKIPKSSYLIQRNDDPTNPFSVPDPIEIDIFKVSEELVQKIKERQKVLKLLYGAIKNSQEFRFLDDDNNNSNQLLTPGNFNNQNIPEVFEHMIEDETYDDYGLGSGSRYVIKRAQIKSMSIGEKKPEFTFVQVNGQVDPAVLNNNAEFNSFPDNGNRLVSAQAIDYDLWRNYGFSTTSVINVPFLSNANTQTAPYAAMLLSRARKNILQGTIRIVGNEFMQPGEVIYLEDRGMLFYVKSVSHSFSFGNEFTTTLELTYGHTPGEYIPEPLDVIGKLLYNNRDIANFIVQRQTSSFNEQNLGVIQRDPNADNPNQIFNQEGSSNTTSFSTANSQTMNNILYTAAYYLNANETVGNSVIAKVQLRYYYDDQNPPATDIDSFAQEIKRALTTSGVQLAQSWSSNTSSPSKQPPFKEKFVDVVPVNMSDEVDPHSPSQKAIDAARNLLQISPQPFSFVQNQTTITDVPEKDKIRVALFNNIIDVWISIEPAPKSSSTTSSIEVNLG